MIYLLESGNFLKIGYTKDIEKRKKEYATHNPEYKILAYKEGDRFDEMMLHRICKLYKYKNE